MPKVKDLSKFDRPREKLEKYGTVKLADHELLAIVLGSGIKGTNVIQLARKIVKLVNEVGLEKITLEDLKGIRGLGDAKAMQIISALEFGRRQFVKSPEIIMTPEKVFELCVDFRNSKKEHFVAFYLDSRNALIAREVISIGILNASIVHPREVFEPALRLGAASIIIVHNHPSGDTTPSNEDFEVTKRLKEAAKLLGIHLQNHFIVTKTSHSNILSKSLNNRE